MRYKLQRQTKTEYCTKYSNPKFQHTTRGWVLGLLSEGFPGKIPEEIFQRISDRLMQTDSWWNPIELNSGEPQKKLLEKYQKEFLGEFQKNKNSRSEDQTNQRNSCKSFGRRILVNLKRNSSIKFKMMCWLKPRVIFLIIPVSGGIPEKNPQENPELKDEHRGETSEETPNVRNIFFEKLSSTSEK